MIRLHSHTMSILKINFEFAGPMYVAIEVDCTMSGFLRYFFAKNFKISERHVEHTCRPVVHNPSESVRRRLARSWKEKPFLNPQDARDYRSQS